MIETADWVHLNLYRVFYYVAKEGSISAASKKLYVSQPAISKSLKKLEESLNTKLFLRNLSGTELTEDGKALFVYVENAYTSLLTAEKVLTERSLLNKEGIVNIESNY